MKILITGGLGYAGSEIAKYLIDKNIDISILDNEMHGKLHYLNFKKKIKFFHLDINDHNKLTDHFHKYKYDIVLHLAAIVGDPAGKKNPKLTINTNLNSSKKIFQFAKKNNVRKFIFFSTCSNYGLSNDKILLSEKSKLKPLSLYAKTKVDFEKYLIKDKSKISKLILRISTLYGLSQRMRYDLTIN